MENVTNTETLIGAVNLGGSADFFDSRGGTVIGAINLGAGADTAFGTAGADTITGGLDADTIDFGGGDDRFVVVNTDGNDNLEGGTGLDTYDASAVSGAVTIDLDEGTAIGGSVGSDLLSGFENVIGSDGGNDAIVGDDVANVLSGLSGQDVIFGAGGRDTLLGGTGADTLTGGTGRDLLYGGGTDNAADIFDFDAIAESGLTGNTRDHILDFEDGFDKIDLSTIDAKTFLGGNQAFNFIGAANFTAAGGQIRAIVTAAGNTLVQVSTDKDAADEMSFLIHGTPALSAGDFVL